MEPDVIRIYSSSPPPMEDGVDEEDDEFGDFDAFSATVPTSVSFSEFETQTTFNQTQALNSTSPPELSHGRALINANGTGSTGNDVSKANGHLGRTEKSVKELTGTNLDLQTDKETLTNGFQGSPSSQKSVHFLHENEEEFANFAAFSETANSEGDETLDVEKQSDCVKSQRDFAENEGHEATQTENAETNQNEPEFANFNAFSSDKECTLESNFTRTGPETGESVPKDDEFAEFVLFPEKETANEDCSSQNGIAFDASSSVCSSDFEPASESDCVESVEMVENPVENAENVLNGALEKDEPKDVAESDGKSSETETETSFGRPLSTEALEEFGDMSTTGSVPSPPLQEENATPTGDNDEGEEDFGDFGDFREEFVNFEQSKTQNEDNNDDFGDFNSPKFKEEKAEGFAEFPASESFGNFSSAAEESGTGWSAFGNENTETTRKEVEEETWAAFSSEETKEEPNRTEKTTVSLADRLEKLFCSSFPEVDSAQVQDQVLSLKLLLEPTDATLQPELPHRALCLRLWAQLLDIHEAFGLRHQWGGSHCNKALLCSLGIDTRNILFTGQKKQPVIVPMYAAGLGMLEPTKEPVKPVSAAEMIASIGQNPSCSSDAVQEALPPVQFDWSSSGLTNPLDGVDPELFELTTAKLDSNRVTDAFARLMSTVQSTSTSTRKPRREENLSNEALKVICAFPDLTFMTAKVLMFPTTLTPCGAGSRPDPGPD